MNDQATEYAVPTCERCGWPIETADVCKVHGCAHADEFTSRGWLAATQADGIDQDEFDARLRLAEVFAAVEQAEALQAIAAALTGNPPRRKP